MGFDFSSLRSLFPALCEHGGGQRLLYLDNAATSQIPKFVLDAVVRHELESRANIQRSSHSLAEKATQAYNNARQSVARFLNVASSDEIVFTAGTTSAINLLAHGFGNNLKTGDEILLSEAEHHSNLIPWQLLGQRVGVKLRFIPVDEEGRLDLQKLPELLTTRCKLVAITHCSNVTGAITDVKPIVAAARAVGARVLLDGAQMVPHGPVDVQTLDIDFYVFSGHKCFAPNGIGVLYGRREELSQLQVFQGGGGMVDHVSLCESRYATAPTRMLEAGTPAIAQAVGLGAAMDWMQTLDWPAIRAYETRLLNRLLNGMQKFPEMKLLGSRDTHDRAPVVGFVHETIHPHDICHILNDYGLALRGGHHCAQPLLNALGVKAATRASLAFYNSEDEVDALLAALEEVIDILT
jgi:cysteine desulfurase / selenocysteine lyase